VLAAIQNVEQGHRQQVVFAVVVLAEVGVKGALGGGEDKD